jgi:hypothetical protein
VLRTREKIMDRFSGMSGGIAATKSPHGCGLSRDFAASLWAIALSNRFEQGPRDALHGLDPLAIRRDTTAAMRQPRNQDILRHDDAR